MMAARGLQRRALDEATRARLRHVKVGRSEIDLRFFPDLLIAGPQRTGTTWLHANLRFHPQVFLAEPKELFFFSRLKTPDHPKFQSNQLDWYLSFFRREPLWRRLAKTAICLRRSHALYRPRVRGEATASYAALDRDVIAEISVLNPVMKVIMMIRDPVDRAWSHAKKDLARKRQRHMEEVSDAELHEFFNDPYQRRCARYVENCDNWAAHLRPGHLLVCFFEDVRERPRDLLLEVMRFLDVDAEERYVPRAVAASVNPTAPDKMPDRHRRFLEDLLRPDLREIEKRFGLTWPLGPHPLALRLP
jgi:hypothetical protein